MVTQYIDDRVSKEITADDMYDLSLVLSRRFSIFYPLSRIPLPLMRLGTWREIKGSNHPSGSEGDFSIKSFRYSLLRDGPMISAERAGKGKVYLKTNKKVLNLIEPILHKFSKRRDISFTVEF